jgi:hypothetical protein
MKHSFYGFPDLDAFLLSFINKSSLLLSKLRILILHYLYSQEDPSSMTSLTDLLMHEVEKEDAITSEKEKEEEVAAHSTSSDSKKEDHDLSTVTPALDLNHIIEYYYFDIIINDFNKLPHNRDASGEEGGNENSHVKDERNKNTKKKLQQQERNKNYLGYQLFLHSIYFPTIYYYLNTFPMENILIVNTERFAFPSASDSASMNSSEAVINHRKKEMENIFNFLQLDVNDLPEVDDERPIAAVNKEGKRQGKEEQEEEEEFPRVSYEEGLISSFQIEDKDEQQHDRKPQTATAGASDDDDLIFHESLLSTSSTVSSTTTDTSEDDDILLTSDGGGNEESEESEEEVENHRCHLSIDVYNKLIHFFIPFNRLLEQFLDNNSSILHWNDDYHRETANEERRSEGGSGNIHLSSQYSHGWNTTRPWLWYEIMDNNYEQMLWKSGNGRKQSKHHIKEVEQVNEGKNVVKKLLPQK